METKEKIKLSEKRVHKNLEKSQNQKKKKRKMFEVSTYKAKMQITTEKVIKKQLIKSKKEKKSLPKLREGGAGERKEKKSSNVQTLGV